MQPSNRFAFKEWAVICQALAEGRQSLIIRKGGIHEGRAGFRVEHEEFWLFPTYLHQSEPETVVEEARPLLASAAESQSHDGSISIQLYAAVSDVFEVR